MNDQPSLLAHQQVQEFHSTGYTIVRGLLNAQEVQRYRQLYDQFLQGVINTGHLRSDLAGSESTQGATENITQIMWPSSIIATLLDGPLHRRSHAIAQQLFGQDMAFDFDMLINKAPGTNTATPWHQDAAYWIDLPDRRALSFWVALDQADVENGCMWFVPESHLEPLRPHRQTGGTGALACACDESEGIAVPLLPGDATIHHGSTLHYSRGNSTNRHRAAYIVNYRPQRMIEWERSQGMDHGLVSNTREQRSQVAESGPLLSAK
jgi:phytanoyl-CoA hydroxylase